MSSLLNRILLTIGFQNFKKVTFNIMSKSVSLAYAMIFLKTALG